MIFVANFKLWMKKNHCDRDIFYLSIALTPETMLIFISITVIFHCYLKLLCFIFFSLLLVTRTSAWRTFYKILETGAKLNTIIDYFHIVNTVTTIATRKLNVDTTRSITNRKTLSYLLMNELLISLSHWMILSTNFYVYLVR